MATQKSADIAALVERGIEFDQVQNWDFDLVEFRKLVAAFCKFIIRAREQVEPGFLKPPAMYVRWKLKNIGQDRDECDLLLAMAEAKADEVWTAMLKMGGSGGVLGDDPLAEIKQLLAGFCVSGARGIPAAIKAAQQGNAKKINWKMLVRWNELPQIRDILDHLPEPDTATGAGFSTPGKTNNPPAEPDGPFDPNGFRYLTVEYRGLQPIPFRLVKHLWKALNRTATFAVLGKEVWLNPSASVSNDAAGAARRQTNRFFSKKGLPFKISIAARYGTSTVTLVCTLPQNSE